MRILLDSNGLQVRAHVNQEEVKGKRITTFLETLESISGKPQVVFSEGIIDRASLKGYDVLIIPTRIEEFESEELDGIFEFVQKGGNILLLSNHAPFHKNDTILADRFGFSFEGTNFTDPESLTQLSGNLLHQHPIISAVGDEFQIQTIVVNSMCSIQCDSGNVIAMLPENMKDYALGLPSKGRIFALSLDGHKGQLGDCKGRLVAIADSGFIGSKGTEKPGRGLIEEGDNSLFIKRILKWLTLGI